MADVTKSNLFSEPRSQILSLINNTANVNDPARGSAEFRKWIHSREPDVKANYNQSLYPYIIIFPSSHEHNDWSTVNGKKKGTIISIEIEIVTSDRGYGGTEGQGLSQMDTICDDVVETLNDLTNRQTLQSRGLGKLMLDATDVGIETRENTLVYRRSIIVTMTSLKTVSA